MRAGVYPRLVRVFFFCPMFMFFLCPSDKERTKENACAPTSPRRPPPGARPPLEVVFIMTENIIFACANDIIGFHP
jgi:hypothetical protein